MKQFREDPNFKKREAVFARWRNAILRESSNPASLAHVRDRALHDPEVRVDAGLAAMITNFIAERDAALRSAQAAEARATHPPKDHAKKATFSAQRPELSRAEAAGMVITLNRQLRGYLANFFEAEARETLGHLEWIASRRPDVLSTEQLEQHRRRLANLQVRRDKLHRHIEEIGRRAVEASIRGDHESAALALRRLSSIHTARTHILPDEDFERLRKAIIHATDQHEHRLAAQRLVDREQRVVDELKGLWATIHHFHDVWRHEQHDSNAYRQAEEAYHRALSEVKSHDPEWLAELILELVGFLDEAAEVPPAAQAHVDHFIESVRTALTRIGLEVDQIEKERGHA